MPWLTLFPREDPGAIAAAAGMRVQGGNLPSALLNRPDPWQQAIAQIAPLVKDYLARRDRDQIANTLMNMEAPPRAEAVNPEAYSPSLAASQGWTGAAEPPMRKPFTGGYAGYEPYKMFQDFQRQQSADELKTRLANARIEHTNREGGRQDAMLPDTAMDDLNYQIKYRKAHPEEFPPGSTEKPMTEYQRQHLDIMRQRQQSKDALMGKVPITLPDGTTVYVTGNAALRHAQGQGVTAKQPKDILEGVDVNTPSVVMYMDSTTKQPVSTQDAEKSPNTTWAMLPNGKSMPYGQYKALSALKRAREDNSQSAQLLPSDVAQAQERMTSESAIAPTPQDQGVVKPSYYLDSVDRNAPTPPAAPSANATPASVATPTPAPQESMFYRQPPSATPGPTPQLSVSALDKPGSMANPVKVKTPSEASQLAPGTYYQTPDGKLKRR